MKTFIVTILLLATFVTNALAIDTGVKAGSGGITVDQTVVVAQDGELFSVGGIGNVADLVEIGGADAVQSDGGVKLDGTTLGARTGGIGTISLNPLKQEAGIQGVVSLLGKPLKEINLGNQKRK